MRLFGEMKMEHKLKLKAGEREVEARCSPLQVQAFKNPCLRRPTLMPL